MISEEFRSIETSTNAGGSWESNPEHLHSLSCWRSATELQQLLCPVIMAQRSNLEKYIYIYLNVTFNCADLI